MVPNNPRIKVLAPHVHEIQKSVYIYQHNHRTKERERKMEKKNQDLKPKSLLDFNPLTPTPPNAKP